MKGGEIKRLKLNRWHRFAFAA